MTEYKFASEACPNCGQHEIVKTHDSIHCSTCGADRVNKSDDNNDMLFALTRKLDKLEDQLVSIEIALLRNDIAINDDTSYALWAKGLTKIWSKH